jgi:hypothetical protein
MFWFCGIRPTTWNPAKQNGASRTLNQILAQLLEEYRLFCLNAGFQFCCLKFAPTSRESSGSSQRVLVTRHESVRQWVQRRLRHPPSLLKSALPELEQTPAEVDSHQTKPAPTSMRVCGDHDVAGAAPAMSPACPLHRSARCCQVRPPAFEVALVIG